MSLWGIVGASYDEMNYFAIPIPFNLALKFYPVQIPKYKINISKGIEGPHKKEVIEFIIGCQQGNAKMLKSSEGLKLQLKARPENLQFLSYFYEFLNENGQAEDESPTQTKSGKTVYYKSQPFSYFKHYHQTYNRLIDINYFQTPFALAVWIMYNGCYKKQYGLLQDMEHFTTYDCEILSMILINKYELKVKVFNNGHGNTIFIGNSSIPRQKSIVQCYTQPFKLSNQGK